MKTNVTLNYRIKESNHLPNQLMVKGGIIRLISNGHAAQFDAIRDGTHVNVVDHETLKRLFDERRQLRDHFEKCPVIAQAEILFRSVKAWRDSDGNEPFPPELRSLIEAWLNEREGTAPSAANK